MKTKLVRVIYARPVLDGHRWELHATKGDTDYVYSFESYKKALIRMRSMLKRDYILQISGWRYRIKEVRS